MNRLERIEACKQKLDREAIAKELYRKGRYYDINDFIAAHSDEIKEMFAAFKMCIKYKFDIPVSFNINCEEIALMRYDENIDTAFLVMRATKYSNYILISDDGIIKTEDYGAKMYSDAYKKAQPLELKNFTTKMGENFEERLMNYIKSYNHAIDEFLIEQENK